MDKKGNSNQLYLHLDNSLSREKSERTVTYNVALKACLQGGNLCTAKDLYRRIQRYLIS